MKIIPVITAIVALTLGLYVGFNVLPYYLSGQKQLVEKDLHGMYDPNAKTGVFHGEIAQVPYIPPVAMKQNRNVLGVTSDEKRIEIDLTNQKLYAFDGNNKVFDFLISSGKWGRTPTGEFRIWTKLRYVKMEGGNSAIGTYYYLPNVPFTMFFANNEIPTWRGYGIHGTYWHSNFGHPMSHGCINMKTEEAGQLYYWANPALGDKQSIRATDDNPGTRVIIYGTAPNE